MENRMQAAEGLEFPSCSRVKCGKTVFNEACALQVERWLLTCDRKSGCAGNLSRNEDIFAFL